MRHLDDGTIHAWLDGALDSAQSAEIDTHVTSCAECSAKVAEARGLIAASSRILTALDDTPANVTPKRAAAPVRRWRAAPWVSGLAAAAILVVLWRTGDVERPTVASDITIPQVNVVASVPEPSLEALKEMPPPPAAADLASTSASSPALTEATRAMVGREDGQRREVAATEALRRSRVDSLDNTRFLALKDEAVAVVGCYRIPNASQPKLEEVVVTGVAEARAPERAARARGAVSSAAPAPAAVQKSAAADVAQGVVVRLDTLGLVRAIGSDSIIGAWNHFKADSARARFGSRTEIVSNLNKVRCP